MKKLLKVKIKRTVGGGKTSYTYPPEYDAQKFNVLTYETQLTGKHQTVVDRGNDHEYVIGTVDEVDAPAFLQSQDIKEINRNQAEQFIGADLEKAEPKITDQSKVLLVLAKVARGESLTQEERDAIDPNSPVKGVSKTRSFKDVLDELSV